MLNFIKNLIARFFPRTVDDHVAAFKRTAARLNNTASRYADVAKREAEQAHAAQVRAADAQTEANRADRVSARLFELLS